MVLGLVTSKVGTLEKKDDLKRRLDEATKLERKVAAHAHGDDGIRAAIEEDAALIIGLPLEVAEGLVRLGHLVRVLAALDARAEAVARVEQLVHRGEPIVGTPEDAYRCFMRTDMDALVVENVVLEKADQTVIRRNPIAPRMQPSMSRTTVTIATA